MKTYLVLIVSLFVCTSLHAQGRQGEGRRFTVEEVAQRQTEWMTEELKLDDTQKHAVDSINLLFTKAQQILFQSFEGDREKIREAMTALNSEKEKALEAVLTSEQLEDYKKKSAERMNNRRRR
ncbi:MAG: DUF4890 domain-containing protein [Tannerella sp.]|jgi:Spy/CpxP family protein refolding chaperone|nr:DUF4890 domain-containing protein [Tannerella sp.]